MPQTIPIGPPPTDVVPGSLIMLPPGFQLLSSVANWRTTWTHIVAGKFSDSPYSGLLCYDRDNGYAAFYETDGRGQLSLLQEHFNWRNSWTQVIPGIFGDSGYDGILLYDQEAGFAAFYDTDGEGSLIPLREYDDWRTSWTHIIVAPFADSRYSGVLLYDKSAGVLAIYATDGQGGINLIRQRDDWLTTWTHIVAGKFSGDPPTTETPPPQFADLFFYDASTGTGDTWATDGRGNMSFIDRQVRFPQTTTDILPGNFGCLAWTQNNGPQEWTNLLFYNRASQSGTVWARGDYWWPVEEISPAPPIPSRILEGAPVQRMRSFPPRPWTLFVTGNFWIARRVSSTICLVRSA